MTTPEDQVAPDSELSIRYTLTLEDGTVVETTEDDEPLHFTMGDGTLIPGLEAVVLGMKAGERRCVRLEPREAFGYPEEGNVHAMPRAEFSEDIDLEPGLIVGFTTPSDEEIPGTILEVADDRVIVDFNHPLAGRTVTFDVEVVEVRNPKRH